MQPGSNRRESPTMWEGLNKSRSQNSRPKKVVAGANFSPWGQKRIDITVPTPSPDTLKGPDVFSGIQSFRQQQREKQMKYYPQQPQQAFFRQQPQQQVPYQSLSDKANNDIRKNKTSVSFKFDAPIKSPGQEKLATVTMGTTYENPRGGYVQNMPVTTDPNRMRDNRYIPTSTFANEPSNNNMIPPRVKSFRQQSGNNVQQSNDYLDNFVRRTMRDMTTEGRLAFRGHTAAPDTTTPYIPLQQPTTTTTLMPPTTFPTRNIRHNGHNHFPRRRNQVRTQQRMHHHPQPNGNPHPHPNDPHPHPNDPHPHPYPNGPQSNVNPHSNTNHSPNINQSPVTSTMGWNNDPNVGNSKFNNQKVPQTTPYIYKETTTYSYNTNTDYNNIGVSSGGNQCVDTDYRCQPPASAQANNAGPPPANAAGPGPGVASSSPKIQGRPGDIRPYRSMIVKLHNDYRRSEGATSMKLLRWSRKLEREAYNHVNKCRYMHQYGSWGENLYKVESFLPDNVLIERALSTWYYEKLSWHWQGDCSEACHYTQMVWSSTAEVGCAFKKCPVLHLREEFLNNGWMLVCFYTPQGNVIGEFPYTHGRPCSECARDDYCDRGLCSSPAPVYRPPPKPRTRPPPTAPPEPRNPPPPTGPPPPKAEVKRPPPPTLPPKPAVFKANIPPVDKKYDSPPRGPAARDQYVPSPPPRQQPAAQNPAPQKPKPDPYQPPPAPTEIYQPRPKQQYQPPPPPKDQPAPKQQLSDKPAQSSSLVSQPARDQNLGVQPGGQDQILDIVANANGVFTTGELRPANNNPHPSLLSHDRVGGQYPAQHAPPQKNGANKSFGVNLGGRQQADPQLAQPPPPKKRAPPTLPPLPPTTTTVPPPPQVQPNCPDKDKHCPSWKVYCDTNPYVHENCRFTCNTCNVPTPPRGLFGPPENKKVAQPVITSAPVRKRTTPPPTQPTTTTTLYPPTYAPSNPPSQPPQARRRRPPPQQRRRKPPPQQRQRPYTQATQPPQYAPTQTSAYGPATQPPYQRTPAYNGFARNQPTTTPYYSHSGVGGPYQGGGAGFNNGPSIPSGVGGGPELHM
ncbi:hypothetical protein FSP39_010786 [Pinctada imbricata]|uniref:ShKT domain-containing protein n=1 Tax=Pinctada imbricata TaxID=66713 RepID=A0AA88Y0A6_PINIB|nr:hypothetical protein FSP39_010786 [Pinctada imbricata]